MEKSVLCSLFVLSTFSAAVAFSFSPVLDARQRGVGITNQVCHTNKQRNVHQAVLTPRRQWNQALQCSPQSQVANVFLEEDSRNQPQSTQGAVEVPDDGVKTATEIEIRRAAVEELTVAYRHRIQQPNLLGKIGMLCSTVLYGTEHLQEAVMKDFQRRYGKDRRNAGFLILALQHPPPSSSAEDTLATPELQLVTMEAAALSPITEPQSAASSPPGSSSPPAPVSSASGTEDEDAAIEFGPSASRYACPSEEDMRHWPPQPTVVGCVGVEIHPLLPNGGRPPVFRRDVRDPTATTWDRVRHRPLLSNLAVDPSCRRQRIGSRLVQACEEEVIRMGFEELLLKVEYCNEIAVSLYSSLGYEGCPGGQMWEDKFVASGSGGEWQKTVNVALRKTLPKPQTVSTETDSPAFFMNLD